MTSRQLGKRMARTARAPARSAAPPLLHCCLPAHGAPHGLVARGGGSSHTSCCLLKRLHCKLNSRGDSGERSSGRAGQGCCPAGPSGARGAGRGAPKKERPSPGRGAPQKDLGRRLTDMTDNVYCTVSNSCLQSASVGQSDPKSTITDVSKKVVSVSVSFVCFSIMCSIFNMMMGFSWRDWA